MDWSSLHGIGGSGGYSMARLDLKRGKNVFFQDICIAFKSFRNSEFGNASKE
jgi:hypothetical protein